nr:DUF1684 domain-containing protein [Flexivirga aerilata]
MFRATWLPIISSPYGLLSPTALHWLDVEPQTFDDVPGSWRLEPIDGTAEHRIVVRLDAADGITVDGAPAEGDVIVLDPVSGSLRDVRHGARVLTPTVFPPQTGQPAQYGVQVRDPEATAERVRQGIPTYPYDPRWRGPAHFERYDERRPAQLHSIVEGLVKDLSLFGEVRFELLGQQHTLQVYAGPPHELHIPFRDATNGDTTFAGSRLVFAPRPASAGGGAFDFEIDFNNSVNGPCGLTPHTTCALPPPGNTLPIAIEAGEQLPPWMKQPSDWAR